MSWNPPRALSSIQPGKGKVDEDIGTSGYYNSKAMNTRSSVKNTSGSRSTTNTGAYAGESADPDLIAEKSKKLKAIKFNKKTPNPESQDVKAGSKVEDHAGRSIDLSKDTPPPSSLTSQADSKRLPPLGMTGRNRRNPSGPNRGVLTTGKRRPEHWPEHDPSAIEDDFGRWGARDSPPRSTSNHNTRSSDLSAAVSKQATPRAPSMARDDSLDDIVVVPARQPRKPATSQPAPFPVALSANSSHDELKSNTRLDKGKAAPAQSPLENDCMTRSSSGKIVISSDDNEESHVPVRSSPPRAKAQAFPMNLSPIRARDSSAEPEQVHARTSPRRPKAKAFPMQVSPVRSQLDQRSPKDTLGKPSGSHDATPTSRDKEDKTVKVNKALSPRRMRRKIKPRPIVKAAKGKAPQAFPMSTEKGPMEDYISQAESDFSSAADALDAMSDAMSDMDDLFRDANLDPKKLCPYCDVPLPEQPTPQLRNILEEVRKKSRPEPRPSNPLGLRADVGLYVLVCERHKFESKWMPTAKAHGWPTHIDFVDVRHRVEGLQSHLQSIVDSIIDSQSSSTLKIPIPRQIKSRSTFWEDIMGSSRGKGAKAAEGVTAQFSSFEKTRPGYYGEIGALTIQQTLYLMFPPDSVDLKVIAPLSHSAFVSQVLVPEAALSLIQQDLQQTKEEALTTMRESAPYGVVLFPDDSRALNGTQGISEADRIMQHRANVRRKELEGFETSMEDLIVPTRGNATSSHLSDDSDNDVGDETILAIVPPARSRKRVERSTSDLTAVIDDPKLRPQHKRQKTPTLQSPAGGSQGSSPSRPTAQTRNRRKPLTQTNIDNTMEVAGSSKPRPKAAQSRRSRSRSCASSDRIIEINDTPKQKTRSARYLDARHSSSDSDNLQILPVRAPSEAASIEMINDKDELRAKASAKTRPTKRVAATFPMASELTGSKSKPPATRRASKPVDVPWSRSMLDDLNSDMEQSDASIPRTTRSRKSSPPKEPSLAYLVDSD